MNTALPTIEGLYAAYAKLFPDYVPQPISFCVIGPTRDELAALAPTVLRFLDEPPSDEHVGGLHLPVQDGDSLRSVAETFFYWFEDYQIPWGLCILLPDGVTVDWPDGRASLRQKCSNAYIQHCCWPICFKIAWKVPLSHYPMPLCLIAEAKSTKPLGAVCYHAEP